MVFMNDQPRSYGGVDGALRVAQRRETLIEAGLELMGSAEPELTVRGVCKKAVSRRGTSTRASPIVML